MQIPRYRRRQILRTAGYIARKTAFVAWLGALAVLLPFYMAPSLVVFCGPTMLNAPKCEKVGESIWLAYMDRIQYWADHGEYGFSRG